jgi:hypothetical protein
LHFSIHHLLTEALHGIYRPLVRTETLKPPEGLSYHFQKVTTTLPAPTTSQLYTFAPVIASKNLATCLDLAFIHFHNGSLALLRSVGCSGRPQWTATSPRKVCHVPSIPISPRQADLLLEATQNVLDPRRVGKQNSGFSDEDISDIICVLYPHSDSARIELERLESEHSPHIIGKDEADGVEPDYALEDQAGRFLANPSSNGSHAIILRLSSQLKNPSAGFVFGRNPMRCDVVFVNDPFKRVSNIHFRIYVNEYGTVMIEDQSTNGTIVDDNVLTFNPLAKGRSDPPIMRYVLSSGSIIKVYLHHEARDLTFRVRIPRRDNEYDQAYTDKVEDFFTRHKLRRLNETITAGPNGHVNLFKDPQTPFQREETREITQPNSRTSQKRREANREWTGSGKYNRIGSIGKGAFAVVHRVTSKYDGLPYAAKEIEKRRFIKNGVLDQKVENEMKIMKRVEHVRFAPFV